jgi:hypothetical protein
MHVEPSHWMHEFQNQNKNLNLFVTIFDLGSWEENGG